jgi:hypothetical protein
VFSIAGLAMTPAPTMPTPCYSYLQRTQKPGQ